MAESSAQCVVCGNAMSGSLITAKEMMFGTGEEFAYLECGICGSLQIRVVPHSLSSYYPSSYYAYTPVDLLVDMFGGASFLISEIGSRIRLDSIHTRYFYDTWKSLCRRFADESVYEHIRILGMKPFSRILDVGCGNGRYLRILRMLGFTHLVGIDPYLSRELDIPGLGLIKKELHELEESFEFVIFNHSFEHIPFPERVLTKVHEILARNGKCMIRTPIVPSYAWNTYRENWIQLDPPRHLFVISQKGIHELAQRCGFHVSRIDFDSNDLQFWGSEQCSLGIPFMSSRSYFVNPLQSPFSEDQIRRFHIEANQLNSRCLGDQAVVVMEKTE